MGCIIVNTGAGKEQQLSADFNQIKKYLMSGISSMCAN